MNLLKSVGVVPDLYMGHSLGETAAGYARGLQTEAETIKIALVRARLSAKIKPGGRMLKTRTVRADLEKFCHCKGFNYYSLPPVAESADAPATAADSEVLNPLAGEGSGMNSDSDEVFDLAGQMAAVGLGAGELQAAIEELGLTQTCVACFNGPKGQTVSGAASEVARLKANLQEIHGDSR